MSNTSWQPVHDVSSDGACRRTIRTAALSALLTCNAIAGLDLEDSVLLTYGEEPAISATNDRVYVVYNGGAGLDALMLARSSNGGSSFELPPIVLASQSPTVTDLLAPSVVASGQKVFVAWQERRSDGSYPLQLRVSQDGGDTFSAATDPSGVATPSVGTSTPKLAYDAGRLYVLFQGTTTTSQADGDLLLRSSTNDGGTFENVVHLEARTSADPGVDYFSFCVVGTDVHVAFERFGGPISLRSSTDSGETFGDALNVTSSESRPEVAARGNSVYLASVLETTSPRRYTVHVRASTDGGASFGSAQVLESAIPPEPRPDIIVVPGLIAVAWVSEQDDDRVVRLATKTIGATEFGAPVTLGDGRNPVLAGRSLGVVAAWQDYEVTVRRSASAPVVFVPGVAGSVLYDQNSDEELWPALTGHIKISLHPQDNPGQYQIVATDPIREVDVLGVTVEEIYGPFLDYLTEEVGFHQYELFGAAGTFFPGRMTEDLCDTTQTEDGPTPDLFLFPYDWRRDNAVNAERLRDYIGCVRMIHPDTDIRIVTHSMGSLLARRYLLDQGSQHHVERLITIGAPWLGAPKMLNVLETGAFFKNWMHDSTIKHILGSFDGAHQLLPSRAYAESLGVLPPLVEAGRDLDGDGTDDEVFTFDELVDLADELYGLTFSPGTTGNVFHSNPGQDDWGSDTLDIDYFHIYGIQSSEQSIAQVRAKVTTVCGFLLVFNCAPIPTTELVLTKGDGTVPLESASRFRGPFDLNDPDATLFAIESPNEDGDKGAEHNGMMKNPIVQAKVIEYLLIDTSAAGATPSVREDTSGASNPPAPQHRLVFVGAATVIVTDESDNELQLLPDQTVGEIPGAASFRLGGGVSMVTLPTSASRSFSIGMVVGSGPVMIELTTGTQDDTTDAVRFLDLDLVAGRSAHLTVSGALISDLGYDSTGDGAFDVTIPATVRVSGSQAADTDPPTITVDQSTHGTIPGIVSLTIEAIDAVSGAATAYSSLDGSEFEQVTAPLDVDPRATPTLWVFADDAVGNRSTRIVPIVDPDLVFADGFESADRSHWE